jgi:hypothetical protein
MLAKWYEKLLKINVNNSNKGKRAVNGNSNRH